MTLHKLVLGATAVAASALMLAVSPALADTATPPTMANPTPVTTCAVATCGDVVTAPVYFAITEEAPDFSSVVASFGGNINKTTDGISQSSPDYFNDNFTFTLPVAGTGSGSLSTSFAGLFNDLDVTGLSIDGVNYTNRLVTTTSGTGGGESLSVSGIPISAYELNTIDVQGYLLANAQAGSFDGTATFVASATPEPATWLLMIGGLGFLGAMLRRRNQGALHFA